MRKNAFVNTKAHCPLRVPSPANNSIEALLSAAMMILILGYLAATLFSIIILDIAPAEVRDTAVLQTVNLFSKGINPYDANYLLTNEPPRVLLDSGFLNILPAVLLVRVFNLPVVFATYFVNYLYLIIGAILFYLTALALSKSNLLSLTSAFLILICFERASSLVVRPDFLAGVFLVAILYVVIQTCSKKVDWTWQIHICALYCVIILYLKLHYAVIALSLAIFFMLVNKRYAITFIISGFTIFFISIFAFQLLCPTHLPVWVTRCLEMLFSHGVSKTIVSSQVIKKSFRILIKFWPVVLVCVVGTVQLLIKYKKDIFRHINIKAESILCFLITNCLVNGVALIFVGGWEGADLWYFGFMLMPTTILLAGYFVQKIHFAEFNPSVLLASFAFLCIMSSLPSYKSAIDAVQTAMDNSSYTRAYALLDQYKSDDMFLAMHLSTYSIANDIYNYDYGDACYVPKANFEGSILSGVFKYSDAVRNKHIQYANEIFDKIDNGSYSIITTNPTLSPFHNIDMSIKFQEKLVANYVKIDTIYFEFVANAENADTEFWIPKT